MAGGTVDIWPRYLFHKGAVTLNFAVNLYTRCVIETTKSPEIVIRSLDSRAKSWRQRLQAMCEAQGYTVQSEYDMDGYRIDLYATRGNRKLLIEVETGSALRPGP